MGEARYQEMSCELNSEILELEVLSHDTPPKLDIAPEK